MFPASSSPWLQQDTSPLKTLIARATYPSQPEPNYDLNLEVAEYINQKKANTPREAAMTVAQLVNHRNPHVAILALSLLDTLVQSCGYPFQLQIATKEFLNELVRRRFPERPPPYPGPLPWSIRNLSIGSSRRAVTAGLSTTARCLGSTHHRSDSQYLIVHIARGISVT